MNNQKKVDKAAVVFIGWLIGTQVFALLLFGPIKRFSGPEFVDVPFSQFIFAGVLSLFGAFVHSIAYLLLPMSVVRRYAFASLISTVCAVATYVVLSTRYNLASIVSAGQPEAVTFFYTLGLSLAVGIGVTVAVVRNQTIH